MRFIRSILIQRICFILETFDILLHSIDCHRVSILTLIDHLSMLERMLKIIFPNQEILYSAGVKIVSFEANTCATCSSEILVIVC